ncbi:MFS transporter [Nocardiopsis dassonvillei]|uniref:MFS transporter n=1 Tax=Nocardiopsis dassonvillei TaxID=2014 RepID=UPI000B9D6DDE|nr:MFS transporter [Nocardiopsis dassonvillei]ASU59909.1 MFS transporter [Nocardiopsis dassonvillei]
MSLSAHDPPRPSATGPQPSAAPSPTVRRVYAVQFVSAVTDGAVLATTVLYFGTLVGLPARMIGLVLALAAGCALLSAAPLGAVADAVGLRRAAVAHSVLVAVALAVHLVADGLWTYAVGAVLFVVAQAGVGAARHALVASQVPPAQRVRARARMHTLLNAGLGAGTVAGALVLAVGTRPAFFAVFAAGAVVALVCAALLHGLPRALDRGGPGPGSAGRGLPALRDPRLAAVTGASALVQMCMPVLSVILPLWLSTRTSAPEWVAAVALGLNTALVLALQTPWSARVRTDTHAARSAAVAGASLAAACVLFGTASAGGPVAAAALILAGIVLLTVGEVGGGPPAWHLALRRAPAGLQGQYQSVFGMAASLARVLGSALALPLVLSAGTPGWAVLGAVMAAAAGVLVLLSLSGPVPGSPEARHAGGR